MMLNFTTLQAETVFSLFLQQQNELQIVKDTGFSLPLVRHILQANKQKFNARLVHHEQWIKAKNAHSKLQEQQCRDMVDAIREVLGFDPLYENDDGIFFFHPRQDRSARA